MSKIELILQVQKVISEQNLSVILQLLLLALHFHLEKSKVTILADIKNSHSHGWWKMRAVWKTSLSTIVELARTDSQQLAITAAINSVSLYTVWDQRCKDSFFFLCKCSR